MSDYQRLKRGDRMFAETWDRAVHLVTLVLSIPASALVEVGTGGDGWIVSVADEDE